jgi:hypothetical protein
LFDLPQGFLALVALWHSSTIRAKHAKSSDMSDPTEQMRKITRVRELVARFSDNATPEERETISEIYDTLTALESDLADSSLEA